MKTIFKNGVYDRVNEEVAESNVKFHGWKYVPKSEWKVATRAPKTEQQVVEAEKKEKTLSNKAKRRAKFNTEKYDS
jgi:glutamate synthase domain-containing protein 1